MRILRILVVFSVLATAGGMAQGGSIPNLKQFFANLPEHSPTDTVEQDLARLINEHILESPPAEVTASIPEIFAQLVSSADQQTRYYALGFLGTVAMRPDGASLLAGQSSELCALITDRDEKVQQTVLFDLNYLAPAYPDAFLPALRSAALNPALSQKTGRGVVGWLLRLAPNDPEAVSAFVNFMQRSDLTASTRIDLLIDLSHSPQPDAIIAEVIRYLDDSQPSVRVRAIETLSSSTNPAARKLSSSRIGSIANDPKEPAQVRQIASEALLGKTRSNPNIAVPPQ